MRCRVPRPRRSALYLPGSNARALEKARSLAADVLLLDCEDAVAPNAKQRARDQIGEALSSASFGRREVVVRVNSLASPWGVDDVTRFAPLAACDALLLPKAETIDSVRQLSDLILAHKQREGSPMIWCMIETPLGVLRAAELAAHPQVECLVAGTSDLSADLNCDGAWAGRTALLPALAQMVMAARAHGKACLDGVHLDLSDEEGLAAACEQGRRLGFDGKTLIHPKTLAVANEAFAPSMAELAHAQRVIGAFEAAKAAGSALVVLEGRLVEELHVRAAERVVALHEAVRELERSASQQ